MTRGNSWLRGMVPALLVALALLWGGGAHAQYESTGPGAGTAAAADLSVLIQLFPDAAEARRDDDGTVAVHDSAGLLLGYAVQTIDLVRSTGFSGQPYLIVAGVDLDGILVGAVLVEHVEPIVHHGTPEALFTRFIGQYRGIDLRNAVRVNGETSDGQIGVDGINTATISAMFMSDSIVQAARRMARNQGILAGESGPSLDVERYEPWNWATMLDIGAVSRLRLTNADIAESFSGRGIRAEFADPLGAPDEAFIDLHIALATPAAVGQNLIGEGRYNRQMSQRGLGDHIVMIAARGDYSFAGVDFWRTDIFDRIQLVQGERVHRFTRDRYTHLPFLSDRTAPAFDEIALFLVPAQSGFDAIRPWRIDLLVQRETVDGLFHYATHSVGYRPPDALFTEAAADVAAGGAESSIVQLAWQDRRGEIAVLAIALAALSAVLFFMDSLVRRRRLYNWLRIAFLSFTLVWIGWYAGAQLTVIHLISYGQVLLTEPNWEFFLIDPLIFIIVAFTLVSLVLWGRGIFCGWLCPFGALQELANKAARALRVPQIAIPATLNQRLWPIKYLVLLGLVGLAVWSMDAAAVASEVEPFKTAITLKFVRAWPFVVYALALLAVGLFVERAFCRFLCPLGAGLAIGGRWRMLDWLKRKPQCGTECRICESSCPVQAIEPSGRINMNECFFCLDCQIDYHDDQRCPPLIARRKRIAARAKLRGAAPAPAAE